MKRPKVIFIDIDGTLINTRTGKSTPQGIWDMKIDLSVVSKIKDAKPEYVFIVSNQSGIGRFVMEDEFNIKLDYVSASIKSYIKHPGLKVVESIYCASVDREDKYRKPNTGMLEYMVKHFKVEYSKSEMIMVGDASGKLGQGDVDLMTARNFGIRYFDINEFLKIYFEN